MCGTTFLHNKILISFILFQKKHWFWSKERSKSVTDPLIIPHRSRLSSAELPVLGGPKRSLLIDSANPYHFRSIQCFGFGLCPLLTKLFKTINKSIFYYYCRHLKSIIKLLEIYILLSIWTSLSILYFIKKNDLLMVLKSFV
jgi:hypothetical protein